MTPLQIESDRPMAYYSRRHYRDVSPPADTPAEIAWRLRDNAAREQARAEQATRYPVLDAANAQEAVAFFEARRLEILTEPVR